MGKNSLVMLIGKILILLVLLIFVTLLVWFTGGSKYVYSHTMYFVILVASVFFGMKGGIIIGLFAAILLGPLMPLEVEKGIMQETSNWVYRLFVFVLLGGVGGRVIEVLREKIVKLQWTTTHNSITGLLSITSMEQEYYNLKKHLASTSIVVFYVCLMKNFDEIVSTFGHKAGEKLLVDFHDRLLQYTPQGTLFFQKRMGKLIGFHSAVKEVDLQVLGKIIKLANKDSFIICKVPVHVELNIGIVSTLNNPDINVFELMRYGMIAQEKASELDKPFVIFKEEFNQMREEGTSLLGQLQHAIDNNELFLEYQARIDLSAPENKSAEALIRWNHPTKGRISPGMFIPLAEKSDLITALTEWTVIAVLKQQQIWQKMGFSIVVSFNISTRNLLTPDFPEWLDAKLQEYEINPSLVEIEVTESFIMQDHGDVFCNLDKLVKIPVSLAIDDFGTGYSSLQYLDKIPARAIKIDRAFIKDLDRDPNMFHIVRTAVTIGHAMNMKIVAEGVETKEQFLLAKKAQIDEIQGYYFHKPSCCENFIQFYENLSTDVLNEIYTEKNSL